MDQLEKEARESVRVWFQYRWQDCFWILPNGCILQKVSDQELKEMMQKCVFWAIRPGNPKEGGHPFRAIRPGSRSEATLES